MPSALIIGSGIAGLICALELSATHEVTVVTKGELAASNTLYAQGGIAAVTSPDDSVEAHILDTLTAAAGLAEYDAVELLCRQAPERVRELVRLGVAFDRSAAGLALGREAAHSHPRILHAGGDATGAAIEHALVERVRERAVRVIEHAFLTDLIVDDARVVGATVLEAAALGAGSSHVRLFADSVVLASGGAGQLYRHTTNPALATGDGVAAAWRAGAELSDIEFYQFHPTALAVPGNFLVSEAVRGEGAVLVNDRGERFMCGVHPDAELAPRDVVARAIAAEMARQGATPVALDASGMSRDFLAERFPTIDAATRAVGLDWSRNPIPVTPAAHYWMGGVSTDLAGHTSLPGLYAIGEVACTGVHGANRLASNSLLEGLVFAGRAASEIRANAESQRSSTPQPPGAPRSLSTPRSLSLSKAPASPHAPVDRASLQQLMWQSVGVSRSGEALERASETLATWSPSPSASPSVAQREDANMLDIARLIVDAALAREESRGAHYRSDYPHTSPDFARHLSCTRQGAFAC